MYYVLRNSFPGPPYADLLTQSDWPGRDRIRFGEGRKVDAVIPVVELIQDSNNQGILTDLLATDVAGEVVSARFRQVLEGAGVSNIDYYPVTIANQLTGARRDDFYIANIVGRIACLDRAQSLYVPTPGDPNGVIEIEEMHLNYALTKSQPIFRLHEVQYIILISPSLKAAIEAAKLTGVEFVEAEGYST